MERSTRLKTVLGKVFDEARGGLREEIDPASYEQARHDFVFHMTDWEKDLGELVELFDRPAVFDKSSASTLVMGFLYHVIPHLNAAGRLLIDEIPDAFSDTEAPQSLSKK